MERKDLSLSSPVTTYVLPETPVIHLLSVALVSKKFRHLLLTNPAQALIEGYRGEMFHLDAAEKQRVLDSRALSLEELAAHLIHGSNGYTKEEDV
ncbi:MAG: hypothetical protein JXA33_21870 [Anaerolineae bacterium]|nr:hypothetical protein [Anaerolineae bacterium]